MRTSESEGGFGSSSAPAGLLCPVCAEPTPLPETSDAGRVETARACVRHHDDEHRRFAALHGDTLPPPADEADSIEQAIVRAIDEASAAPAPRWVPLFGVHASRIYGTHYQASVGQLLYTGDRDASGWRVAIHNADSFPHLASCWAIGQGATLANAELACERMLRREGKRRAEAAQEIAERRRVAA